MTDIVVGVGEFVMLGRADNGKHITCLRAFAELTENDIGWSDLVDRAVKWLVRYTGATYALVRIPITLSRSALARWPEEEEAWTNCPPPMFSTNIVVERPNLIVRPVHFLSCRKEKRTGFIYLDRADIEPDKGGDQFFHN